MSIFFYFSAAIALIATLFVITARNAVHALLYLIVSLLAIALIFVLYGAPFAAALEVIVYAGAIMVLILFVIMMMNQGDASVEQERQWLAPAAWIGPGLLSAILLLLFLLLIGTGAHSGDVHYVGPRQVGAALFGHYLLAVELASMVLLAGLVGAFHLARRDNPEAERPGHD
ncbi:NADH-quinone oxidoreductase subunit J [Microbulbifer guangxiensis]|uniref:NADH-quinone oxidoreductase subunit J n=1 Tax=Microbulbifer guangxiensis TaxID=2904249 RepID=UPI001F008BBC|nr:NADH-quinone oxidoreductase subunit J [Microbulbifer guangxiensis]